MSRRMKVAAGALALVLATAGVALAANDNGVPAGLARIEALVRQVLAIVNQPVLPPTPPPPTTTRLLFPFVSNQAGFDTGIAVSNTGLDSTGAPGKAGVCTIHYFGRLANGSPPPITSQTTSAPVPAGGQLAFTLSTGGSLGIVGVPNFQGYIEVVCDFPLAHGYGLLTDGPIGAARIGTAIPALVVQTGRRNLATESAGQ